VKNIFAFFPFYVTFFEFLRNNSSTIKNNDIMKRIFFSILTVGFLMTTVCNGASVMTMTTSSDKVKIYLAGSGTVTIDWGDGSEIMAYTLGEYNARWFRVRNEYSHNYANETSRTITITGECITHMDCTGNQLTSLDVSRNPNIILLECRFNQLTSLDVSKNVNMKRLIVQGNQLTNLDVSNNVELTGLDFSFNRIKNLNLSNNTNLTRLSGAHNPIIDDAYALNNLLKTLNSNSGKKIIQVSSNCKKDLIFDKKIVQNNRWRVNVLTPNRKGKFFIPDIV